MAQPSLLTRLIRYLDYQGAHPSAPFNGSDHDAEHDQIVTVVNQIRNNLGLIQRDDTALKNASVHPDSLSTATKALIAATWTPRGLWVTATAYVVGDLVQNSTTSYVCATAHTAGVFATDYAAGKWLILGETAAAGASAVSFSPAGDIVATDVQAAIEELDAEKAPKNGSASNLFSVNDATGANHAVAMQQIQKNSLVSASGAGTGDAITATLTSGLTALNDGMAVLIEAPGTNSTTTPTFNLTLGATATGAKTIVKGSDQALVAGDIASNKLHLVYDSSLDKWVLINPLFPVGQSTATTEADSIINLGITFSVGSSALLASIKTAAGANPTASDSVRVSMPSATLSAGQYAVRTITDSTCTLTVSSGSTLGHSSAVEGALHWYLIDNAGTLELAVSSKYFGASGIVSTTAEGGAGAADSATVMYSTAARSNVPFRWIGKTLDTQATAGTWGSVPTNVGLLLATVGTEQIDDASVTEPKLAAGISRPSEVRQTVLTAKTNSSGYADFIEAGTGLQVKRMCATVAGVFSFAAGYSNAGARDYISRVTADNTDAYGALTASNTNFLYEDYVNASSVTGSSGLVPPQDGYAFDQGAQALLNFEGSNGATTTTDDFGNTWTLTNATISTAQAKFGGSSLRIGAGNGKATCTEITSLGDGSWTVRGWFRPDTGATAQIYFAGYNTGGTYGLQVQTNGSGNLMLYLSAAGSSWDIASAATGSTVLANGTWYRIRLTFDALAGTYRVYLSNNGAAETQEITVSSTARVNGLTAFYVGYHTGSSMIGYVDGFQIIRAATATSAETPSASAPAVTDYPVHFFSIPDMTMYEVTAASASAGTNPTLTARNRLFVGEAETNGSGVTAVRNYALRGEYKSAWAAILGTNTAFNVNTNMGTKQLSAQMQFLVGTGLLGYAAGQIIDGVALGHDGVPLTLPASLAIWRNTINSRTGASSAYLAQNLSNGNAASVSSSATPDWKYRVTARRSF